MVAYKGDRYNISGTQKIEGYDIDTYILLFLFMTLPAFTGQYHFLHTFFYHNLRSTLGASLYTIIDLVSEKRRF